MDRTRRSGRASPSSSQHDGDPHPGPPDLKGTHYETPAQLAEGARADGCDYGAAQVPARQARGRDAAPNRKIAGVVGARKSQRKQDAVAAMQPARARQRTVAPRKRIARRRASSLRTRLDRLMRALPAARQRVLDSRDLLDDANDHWLLRMSRPIRGYFETIKPVVGVAIAVAVFDGGVAHAVLEYSGLSTAVVWITTISVPLLILAINHAFGVLAGAIALHVSPRSRVQLAVAALVAGVGAAVVSFVLLMLFREQAVAAQNEGLRALTAGDPDAELTFFISPIWIGFLQIAGSFAAMTMSALWTMGKPGREYREMVVEPLTADWEDGVVRLNALEEQIAGTRTELEQAVLVEHEVEADGQAAAVEVEAETERLRAALEGEDALREALQSEYETHEQYHEQIGRNGKVLRVALPTEHPRFGEPHTPAPRDVAADGGQQAARHPQREPIRRPATGWKPPWRGGRANGNGHHGHALDPDQLRPL